MKLFGFVPVSAGGLILYGTCLVTLAKLPAILPTLLCFAFGSQTFFFLNLKKNCILCELAFALCLFLFAAILIANIRVTKLALLLVPAGFITTHIATMHAHPLISPYTQTYTSITQQATPCTITIFLNPACPHCKDVFTKYVPAIKREFPKKVKINVHMLFPPDDNLSTTSSIITIASGKNFAKVLKRLLLTQTEWINSTKICKHISDIVDCQEILTPSRIAKAKYIIKQSMTLAQKLGIHATPSFYITGKNKSKLFQGLVDYKILSDTIKQFVEE
jgi:multisubunit Na+/H+ antiporter MnhE subunit